MGKLLAMLSKYMELQKGRVQANLADVRNADKTQKLRRKY